MKLVEINWEECRDEVIAAIGEFAKQNKTRLTGTKYFIWYKGHAYPPKDIRGIWKGVPKNKFSGGDGTNRLFYNLGFTVVTGVHRLAKYGASAKKDDCEPEKALQAALSPKLDKLFQKTWAELTSAADVEDQPGVYLLAYSSRNLGKEPVEPRDVFYVGMSTTSLRTRLNQFLKGIENNQQHSGAKRFYKRWAGCRSYSSLTKKNTFFVATLPVACEPNKGRRTAADLERLGMVSALEFFALARIKLELEVEPPLNKK